MCDYTFFSKDTSWWNEAYQSLWGCHDICPILEQFHVVQVTQIRALFSHLLTGMGWPQKISQQCCLSTDIAQRGYHRTEGVWACYVWVHPYQARVSTIDNMARQLTLLGLTGPMHLCSSMGIPITCLSQKRVTWAPWLKGCLATSHVEGSANWRPINFCIWRPE